MLNSRLVVIRRIRRSGPHDNIRGRLKRPQISKYRDKPFAGNLGAFLLRNTPKPRGKCEFGLYGFQLLILLSLESLKLEEKPISCQPSQDRRHAPGTEDRCQKLLKGFLHWRTIT